MILDFKYFFQKNVLIGFGIRSLYRRFELRLIMFKYNNYYQFMDYGIVDILKWSCWIERIRYTWDPLILSYVTLNSSFVLCL